MARWITVRKPFDYAWPGRQAVTHFADPGELMVKDEVADFAIDRGYATEGKVDGSARSKKGGAKRVRRKKEAPAAANPQSGAQVGDKDPAEADRAPDRASVADDAG